MVKIKLKRHEWTKLLSRGKLIGGFKLVSNNKCEAIVYDERRKVSFVCCK